MIPVKRLTDTVPDPIKKAFPTAGKAFFIFLANELIYYAIAGVSGYARHNIVPVRGNFILAQQYFPGYRRTGLF